MGRGTELLMAGGGRTAWLRTPPLRVSSCIRRASDIWDAQGNLASTRAPDSSLASFPQGRHPAPKRSGLEKSISTDGCRQPGPVRLGGRAAPPIWQGEPKP